MTSRRQPNRCPPNLGGHLSLPRPSVDAYCEPLGFGCPDFADVSIWRQAARGFELAAMVVGIDEVVEVRG